MYIKKIYTICTSENVILRKIGDANLLVPIRKIEGQPNNRILYLNQTGELIWNNIDICAVYHDDNKFIFRDKEIFLNISKLIGLIKERFNITDDEEIETDIKEFIAQLINMGFVLIL